MCLSKRKVQLDQTKAFLNIFLLLILCSPVVVTVTRASPMQIIMHDMPGVCVCVPEIVAISIFLFWGRTAPILTALK